MAEKKRKADVFGQSKGSLANRLMQRRMLLESGDPEAARAAFNDKLKIQKRKKEK